MIDPTSNPTVPELLAFLQEQVAERVRRTDIEEEKEHAFDKILAEDETGGIPLPALSDTAREVVQVGANVLTKLIEDGTFTLVIEEVYPEVVNRRHRPKPTDVTYFQYRLIARRLHPLEQDGRKVKTDHTVAYFMSDGTFRVQGRLAWWYFANGGQHIRTELTQMEMNLSMLELHLVPYAEIDVDAFDSEEQFFDAAWHEMHNYDETNPYMHMALKHVARRLLLALCEEGENPFVVYKRYTTGIKELEDERYAQLLASLKRSDGSKDHNS